MPRPSSGVQFVAVCLSGVELCAHGASDCIYPPHSTARDRVMSRDGTKLPERLPRGWRVASLSEAAPIEGVFTMQSMQASSKTGHKDAYALSPCLSAIQARNHSLLPQKPKEAVYRR